MIRKTKRKYGCPVEFSIDQLSGKWKTVILSRLKVARCATASCATTFRSSVTRS